MFTRLLLLFVPIALVGLWCTTAEPQPAAFARAVAAEKPSFAKEGLAFLQKHCASCHNEKTKRADVTFHTIKTEEDLVKARKLFQSVHNVLKSGEMPPPTRKRPMQSEIDDFQALVKDAFARADKNAKPDPGRVTVRRLNRTEYNNTIRDLVGVDFQPAEDFPSDDIGHGFDNIGDVLTLSPVLLERYLAAAESIMDRAIQVNPPKPPERWMNSTYLEPGQGMQFKFRPVDPKSHSLNTPYKLSLAGEYTFRAKVYATLSDMEPAKVAILNGDKQIQTFEVSAAKEKPQTLEVKLTLPKGDHRFFVKLLNPTEDKKRNLFIEWFYLAGPSDTRPETQKKLLAVTPGTSQPEQTREVLTRFVTKAYRRPAAKDEIDRLVALVDKSLKSGQKWEAAMQIAMQAVLVSPKFLFRLEADAAPREEQPYRLDEYQLASRLSYFLWSTMPDDELLSLATKNQLTKNLDAQIARMLKDPKAEALVENFAMQWLQLRRLKTHAADTKMFPKFNDSLRAAMLKETELFLAEIVREDRSILTMLDADFTYINNTLGWHYGYKDTAGNNWHEQKNVRPGGKPLTKEFVRVPTIAKQRGGLLTQASVLTVTSNPTRTSPVKRGRWVLEQILGTPPPPAPPDVPELDEGEKAELTGSLRQRMEQHRKNPACANCHAKMDPMGFAFENYDAVGGFRWKDGKFDIDASGTLPDGKSFKGPEELKKILLEKKELFARSLAEKLLIYALGRGVEYYDNPTLDAVTQKLGQKDYKFSVLVTEIAKSLPFTHRRGKQASQ
jgi:hypothetical protein